jgi:hypothetical protein
VQHSLQVLYLALTNLTCESGYKGVNNFERCFMSYKSSQLFPLSTRGANFRISIQRPWSSPAFDYGQAELLRSSWLIYDPELDAPRRMNRDVMLGMALALVISASFWAGVGLAIAQVWK